MSEEREKLHRVYGRGFHDGLKAAGKALATEKDMNETRFNSLFRGITEQAKKVYEAVPLSDHWSVGQIIAELDRLGYGNREQRIVSGCLNSLKEVGLVKEISGNKWIRTEIRMKRVKVAETVTQTQTTQEQEAPVPAINTQPTPQKAEDLTPLERIGSLSSQVLTIIQSLHQLAADIEATAIEVEEQIEKINKDGEKLKQLQALLKSLS